MTSDILYPCNLLFVMTRTNLITFEPLKQLLLLPLQLVVSHELISCPNPKIICISYLHMTQPVSDTPYNDEFEDSAGDEEVWRRKIVLAHIKSLATPLCVYTEMTYSTILRFQAQKSK